MSCIHSHGVVMCQTNPLGVIGILLAITLVVLLAYYIGRTHWLRDRVTVARVAETPEDDPRDD